MLILIKEILVGIIATFLLALITMAFQHRQYLGIAINSYLFSRNKRIRVSMAAILTVKREACFILIRNHHRPEFFGPIGGVFKYHPSADEHLERCGFEPQIRDRDMKYDLRGYLVGKNLPGFLKWFFSGKNREIDALSREIREELQEIGLQIEDDIITGLKFDLLKKVFEGLDKVPGTDYLQLRYFEVYSLCSGDPKCIKLNKKLFREVRRNSGLIAVTAEDIMRRIAPSGELIAGNSGYLIGNKRMDEPPPMTPVHPQHK